MKFKKENITTEIDNAVSLIGENIIIDGDVNSTGGSVEILGIVNGNCNTANTTIRETGIVNGDITSDNIKIKGAVNGNIHGGVVKIFSTAIVSGDISYQTLSIEDGADLNSTCKRIKEKEKSPTVILEKGNVQSK